MPLMNQIARFARSPQGRRMAQQAMSYARSPEGKRKIAQVREQLAARRKPGPPR
jgi:hypothetical protein